MMNALPQAASSLPSPFAGLIPSVSANPGEVGGFDQLFAGQVGTAEPTAVPATARFAAPTPTSTPIIVPEAPPAAAQEPTDAGIARADISTPDPTTVPKSLAAAVVVDQLPSKASAAPTVDLPAPIKVEPVTDNGAATGEGVIAAAARLAGHNSRNVGTAIATPPPKVSARDREVEPEGETSVEAPAPVATETPIPWTPAAPAAPTVGATANPKATPAKIVAPHGDDVSTGPAMTVKARAVSQAFPGVTPTASEPNAVKANTDPAITIVFAQQAVPTGTDFDIAKPVVIAERVLDLTSDDAWIDQLASDIAATKSETNDISFRLMPRHLGRLDVSMIAGDEGVSVKLDTQHEATATIVAAAQARLVDDLRQQGVRVTEAQVSCTPGETGRQSQGQDRASPHNSAHLIETLNEPAEARDEGRAADPRGRFA